MSPFELHSHTDHFEHLDERHATKRHRAMVSPLYQIVLIAISAIFLSATFYYRANIFKSKDPIIPYRTIDPEAFRKFGGFANNIEVGLYINEFEEFSVIKNNFVFSGQLWFSFPPGTISIDTLQKFSFTRGNILYQSMPMTYLVGDNILIQYSIKVQLKNPLDLADFPMDDHIICIQLQHLYISPNELFFTTRLPNFVDASPKSFGWEVVDKEIKSGYIELNLDQMDNERKMVYPTVLFFLDIVRTGMQYTLTLFLPLLLVFFLTLFCFSLKETGPSISITAGGVTTILAYRFVIASLAPEVGYFILIDYLFLLFLSLSIFIFFLNLTDVYYAIIGLTAKKIMIVLLHIIVNGVTMYLLLK